MTSISEVIRSSINSTFAWLETLQAKANYEQFFKLYISLEEHLRSFENWRNKKLTSSRKMGKEYETSVNKKKMSLKHRKAYSTSE